ncbi:MAG: CsgG/HfaB family protein, partial [Candidatus Electryonea clarkiae]|nr:CsgG/HfaB family protein [Candidatus Electryonea clarkiae]
FRVIERNNMEDILTEQGFQFSGCTSDECAVEVGQLLGVQQMIAGSISKLGELHTVSLRLIDVETGEVLDMQSARCRCSIEEVAETSLADAAQAITGKGNVSRQSTTGRQVVGVHYRGCGSYGFPVVVL